MTAYRHRFAPGVVTKHEVTGGCWIDGRDISSLHDHHVIPRNAGGERGPQVTICSSCHDGIHHAAKIGASAVQYCSLEDAKERWATHEAVWRAEYLIGVIVRSEALAATSDNKTTKMGLLLPAQDNTQLTRIAKRLGLSKHDTVLHLIRNYRIDR